MYGLPKLHKEGSPLRPVVSYISYPTHPLAKFLDKWFKQITSFESHLSIQNSSELITSLAQPPLPVSILISFDIVGLFPHVPLIPNVDYVEELLREAAVPTILIKEYRNLLQYCLSPNVCQFNGLAYRLPADIGIPIGSPLGSLISKAFMDKFELQLLQSNHPFLKHIDSLLILLNISDGFPIQFLTLDPFFNIIPNNKLTKLYKNAKIIH